MNKKIISVLGIVVIALGVYLFMINLESNDPKEMDTQSIKQLVHDYSVRTLSAESASITSHQLIVTNRDSNKVTYDLIEDEFFVSIAPYVNVTHPCAIHSLTGCQGEMVDEEFHVFIEDTAGDVIIDETMRSQANGFIDLWLPRDQTFHVTIEHDGEIAESEITTFENDNTCITTMHLKES